MTALFEIYKQSHSFLNDDLNQQTDGLSRLNQAIVLNLQAAFSNICLNIITVFDLKIMTFPELSRVFQQKKAGTILLLFYLLNLYTKYCM